MLNRFSIILVAMAACTAVTARNTPSGSTLNSLSEIKERPWFKYLQTDELKAEPPEIQSFRLSNGIAVYYTKNAFVPKAYATVYLDGGSFEEENAKTGITSIWGSTLTYSGSEQYPRKKLAQHFENRGSDFSFSSSLQRSSFSVSSLTDYFTRDLKIALQVLKNPRFAEKDLSLIKKQTLQSIRKRTEKPSRVAYLAAKHKQYPANPRGTLSTKQSVGSIAQKDVQKWHKRMFNPARMTIALAGKMPLKEVKQILEEELGSLKPSSQTKPDFTAIQPKKNPPKAKIFQVEQRLPQTTILWRTKGFPHHHEQYLVWRLANAILGGDSFNSVLTKQIRSKHGWAYSAYSTYSTDQQTGEITLFTQTANANVNDVMRRMQEILENPEKYISKDRVEMAKTAIKNKFVFLYETPEQYLSLRLKLMWDGLPDDYLKTYLDRLEKVTRNDVVNFLKNHYSPREFFVMLVGPENVYSPKRNKYFDDKLKVIELPQ